MRIQSLIENTSKREELKREHGLSFYIETKEHKVLFDTGASEMFIFNAKLLGIDLRQVDMAVLSHGHYDHGGGLPEFLKLNDRAIVYMKKEALEPHYSRHSSGISDIGIKPELADNPRVVFTKDVERIENGLLLFSGVTKRELFSEANQRILIQTEAGYEPDPFFHEQNLLLTEGEKTVLFSGCSHSGVVNILDKCREMIGAEPDILIGGFHFSKPRPGKPLNQAFIDAVGRRLQTYHTKYYTCHCTGEEAYQHLRALMGEQIRYISTGEEILLSEK